MDDFVPGDLAAVQRAMMDNFVPGDPTAVELRMMDVLEQAAFAAWPALEEIEHDGWRLRSANGYTKRANSANATAGAQELTPSRIEAIEAWYRQRALPPVFRLPSFCASAASDEALAARGYRFADMSLVMTMPLPAATAAPAGEQLPHAAAWLSAWPQDGAEDPRHQPILAAIEGECAFGIARHEGQVACRGLGVFAGGLLGLFDIETHPDLRRRGLARALCADLLAWGAQRGAHTAFLQVVAANVDAIALYEGLGFRRRYHYWYRVGPGARRPA